MNDTRSGIRTTLLPARRSTLARRRRDQGEVVEACPGAANHPVISFVPHETPPLLSLRAGGETFAIRCISRGLRMQPLNAAGMEPGTSASRRYRSGSPPLTILSGFTICSDLNGTRLAKVTTSTLTLTCRSAAKALDLDLDLDLPERSEGSRPRP